MGVIRAFTGAISGTFADQWRDIITAGNFDEHVAVAPGVQTGLNNGRGTNIYGSTGVLTNGSKIYVPENCAAFVFDQSGIEGVITVPGGYVYQNGQQSIMNGDGFGSAIFQQAKERFTYGGISPDNKRIAFVNLREIRDIKFGTRGAQVYNDLYYGTDLEIYAYGCFSVKISDPILFIKNFVPPNTSHYSFDDERVRGQLIADFLQSFIVALNSLSNKYRISSLPSQANELSYIVANDVQNAGTWKTRFGFEIVKVSIENIEFTEQSRALVNQYSSNKMNMKSYDDVSQNTANMVAQQKIAQGIQDNGFGNAGGMIMGMNLAQGVGANSVNNAFSSTAPEAPKKDVLSIDEQIEAVKKLKELVDTGILSDEEFEKKKKEIMGL